MTETIWQQLADRYDPAQSYVRRPVAWSADKTGLIAWSRQREIMESVRDNRYTAVPSAHDLGKSRIAAEIMAWWIDSHPVGEAFVVSTAPSAAQVSAILWREVSKAHRIAKLFGKINRAGYPQWYYESELIGYGRKPADYEDSAFQGIHAKYVLVVIDEACGVTKHLYDAVDSLVTNEHCRVLAIGNPDNPGSHFAAICKPGHKANRGWNVIRLDGLRSPNMTYEIVVGPDPENPRFPLTALLMEHEAGLSDDEADDPQSRAGAYVDPEVEVIPEHVRDYLLTPIWIEERIARWAGVGYAELEGLSRAQAGELVARRCAASSLFTAKVRGVFPPTSTDGVIPLSWVMFAVDRWRRWHDQGADTSRVPNPTRFVLGVDVARGGEDETCFAPRFGDCIPKLYRFRIADTMETADEAAVHLMLPQSLAVVDVIGIGAGVFDKLRRMKRQGKINASVMMFTASGSTWRRDFIGAYKFRNDRSAAWYRMREKLDPSRGSQIMLPDDDLLIEELVAPRYKHLENGVISVETKDDIKARLGRSTDSADAVIQAFWPSGAVFADPESANVGRWPQADLPRNGDVIYPAGYTPVTGDDLLITAGARRTNDTGTELVSFDDLFAGSGYSPANPAAGGHSGHWDHTMAPLDPFTD